MPYFANVLQALVLTVVLLLPFGAHALTADYPSTDPRANSFRPCTVSADCSYSGGQAICDTITFSDGESKKGCVRCGIEGRDAPSCSPPMGFCNQSSGLCTALDDEDNSQASPTGGGNTSSQASGSGGGGGDGTLINPLGVNSLPELLNAILKGVVQIGSILLVLAIVYVGFLFVFARGDTEQIKNARNALLWTVIGGILLLGAQAISMVIQATVQNL